MFSPPQGERAGVSKWLDSLEEELQSLRAANSSLAWQKQQWWVFDCTSVGEVSCDCHMTQDGGSSTGESCVGGE